MHKKAFSLAVFIAALFCASVSPIRAQAQQPAPAAIAVAREVIIAKGVTAMTVPLVFGVIERAKDSLVPTNPNLMRELNEVATALHKELDAKGNSEVVDQVARAYASRFTEQELKDLLAFYKTPLGQKLTKEEPAALEDGLQNAQNWADAFSKTIIARIRTEMQKRGHTL
jgi:uncharacterized protein